MGQEDVRILLGRNPSKWWLMEDIEKKLKVNRASISHSLARLMYWGFVETRISEATDYRKSEYRIKTNRR